MEDNYETKLDRKLGFLKTFPTTNRRGDRFCSNILKAKKFFKLIDKKVFEKCCLKYDTSEYAYILIANNSIFELDLFNMANIYIKNNNIIFSDIDNMTLFSFIFEKEFISLNETNFFPNSHSNQQILAKLICEIADLILKDNDSKKMDRRYDDVINFFKKYEVKKWLFENHRDPELKFNVLPLEIFSKILDYSVDVSWNKSESKSHDKIEPKNEKRRITSVEKQSKKQKK